jgi:hypothetical protein
LKGFAFEVWREVPEFSVPVGAETSVPKIETRVVSERTAVIDLITRVVSKRTTVREGCMVVSSV